MVGKALKQWLRAAVFCLETYPVFSRLFVYHQIQSFHYLLLSDIDTYVSDILNH
jgi:hypothetical protein